MSERLPLPREAVELALPRALPCALPAPSVARELCQSAIDSGGRFWTQPPRRLCRNNAYLRGAWLRYDAGQALAIGRAPCLNRASPAWFAATNGELLQHAGQILLFAERGEAMRAATLAAVSMSLQRVYEVAAGILYKPEEQIIEADVVSFDEAATRLRGTMKTAAQDWFSRSISFPITAHIGPTGRRIIAKLLDGGLSASAGAIP